MNFVHKDLDQMSTGIEREVSSKYLNKDDFMWRLDNFLWQRRCMKTRELQLGGLPLSLEELYVTVLKNGGYDQMLTVKGKSFDGRGCKHERCTNTFFFVFFALFSLPFRCLVHRV